MYHIFYHFNCRLSDNQIDYIVSIILRWYVVSLSTASDFIGCQRRIALHKYDPVDLQQSFAAAQEAALTERQNVARISADSGVLTAKEKEIANSGLTNLVHVTTNDNSHEVVQTSYAQKLDSFSPRTPSVNREIQHPRIATPEDEQDSNQGGLVSELNQWEAARQENEFFSGEEDDDSDDDLL